MMNCTRITCGFFMVILGIANPALSQELLVFEGARLDRVVEPFVDADPPDGWEDTDVSDPNGRPVDLDSQRFVTLDIEEIRRVFDPNHKTPYRVDMRFMENHIYMVVVEDIRISADTGARQIRGRVRGDDLSRLILTVSDDYVRGTLHTLGKVLEFRKANNGISFIQVLDPTQFPMERSPRPAHRQSGFNMNGPQPFGGGVMMMGGDTEEIIEPYDGETYADTEFEPAEFTVLALKTTQDFPFDCDTESLELDADAYTNNLETIFGDYALGSVSFQCVTPSTTQLATWTTLESIRQYLMTGPIKTLRDNADADLVVMIVKDGLGFCGYAMHPDYPLWPIELYGDQYREDAAFAVVDETCALGQMSFAHEIGHLLGMKHERFSEQGGVNNFCGYGYPVRQMGQPIAVTVMSYDSYCDYLGVSCSRVPYYSIPRKKASGFFGWFQNTWHRWFGKIKGKSCAGQRPGHLRRPANNTMQLINSAELVAKYRPIPP